MFLERAYDDTPVHLAFGLASDLLRPHVKFIVPRHLRGGSGGAATVSYADALKLGLQTSQHGVMDIVNQHM
eukprot:2804269-Pyramimonas_sp.AAC.1